MTVGTESSSAKATPCSAPAPPKATKAKSRGSYPFEIDTNRRDEVCRETVVEISH